MTQNNLGNALKALGGRESGTARLEEAVAAYQRRSGGGLASACRWSWALAASGCALALEALADRGSCKVDEEARASAMPPAQRAREQHADAIEVYREGSESYWLPLAEASIARMRRQARTRYRRCRWPVTGVNASRATKELSTMLCYTLTRGQRELDACRDRHLDRRALKVTRRG